MCTSKMQKNPYENVIAVTNRSLCQRPFAEQIERVCSLHPKAVILREKDLPEEEYSRLAEQILEICKRYQVPCILHTYVNVAEKLHHPYIHLPIFLLEKYEGKLGGFRQIGCIPPMAYTGIFTALQTFSRNSSPLGGSPFLQSVV